jgi:hypothetical protein
MLRHRARFIIVPALILVGSVVAGWLSGILYPAFFPFRGTKVDVFGPQGWKSPLGVMLALYFVWNTWHFAKQNFGVLSIYRVKSGSGRRTTDLVYALGVHMAATILGILMMCGLATNAMIDLCVVASPVAIITMLSLETRMTPRVVVIVVDALRLALLWVPGLWIFAISGLNHWLAAIGLSSHVHARR